MKIDIVLPTYNRSALLQRAIGSFIAAEVPPNVSARLIIVDNNSSDDTSAVVAKFMAGSDGRLVHLFEARQGKVFALNTGIAFADAELIGLFDDDEVLQPEWLEVISRNMADPEVDFVGGRVLPDWMAPIPDWFPETYRGVLGLIDHGDKRMNYGKTGVDRMLTGANAVIRRNILQQCGPYSEHNLYSEDRYMDLQLKRIGARGIYDPELVVLHAVPAWRLTKKYYRHWVYTEGCTTAAEVLATSQQVPHWLGAPAWAWRRALSALARMASALGPRRRRERFEAQLTLVEFWGYLWVRLFGRRQRYRDRTTFSG